MRRNAATDWTDGTTGDWQIPGDSADAKAAESDLPPMEDAAELISKPIDLPPDVIEGVLHRGAKMVLGGGSKTFKTWTLVDLAISVATGNRLVREIPHKAWARSLYQSGIARGVFRQPTPDRVRRESSHS